MGRHNASYSLRDDSQWRKPKHEPTELRVKKALLQAVYSSLISSTQHGGRDRAEICQGDVAQQSP